MGTSLNNSYVMLSRLRDQVERSLGALLIARLGREDCEELDALLEGWDGRFSPLLRKRVARHVDGCDVCRERRAAVVSPLALLAAAPIVPAPVDAARPGARRPRVRRRRSQPVRFTRERLRRAGAPARSRAPRRGCWWPSVVLAAGLLGDGARGVRRRRHRPGGRRRQHHHDHRRDPTTTTDGGDRPPPSPPRRPRSPRSLPPPVDPEGPTTTDEPVVVPPAARHDGPTIDQPERRAPEIRTPASSCTVTTSTITATASPKHGHGDRPSITGRRHGRRAERRSWTRSRSGSGAGTATRPTTLGRHRHRRRRRRQRVDRHRQAHARPLHTAGRHLARTAAGARRRSGTSHLRPESAMRARQRPWRRQPCSVLATASDDAEEGVGFDADATGCVAGSRGSPSR